MGKITKTLLYILGLLVTLPSFSQKKLISRLNAEVATGLLVSTNNRTPFLLRANQYGTVPLASQFFYISPKIKKEYDSLFTIDRKLKKFDVGYEVEPHINLGQTSQILLPQAYAKLRYGSFEFYAGRRREIQGLVDTTGTMGSFIWSGNALPMPKVEISIPNYTPIIKNSLIAIKGNFAHGWFASGDSVQKVWLHQKSFYAKIGKVNWKIHLIGGFNHQVMWGGYPTVPFYDYKSEQTISKFESNFPTFLKVASGVSLNRTGNALITPNGVPSNEAINRAGNHLGTIDLGIDLNLPSFGKLLIYRQNFFEDGSLFYLNNITDGLFGLNIRHTNKILKNICFEYLDSRSQGGELFGDISELRGRDNYFNNDTYKDGWVYKKLVIGNPLFLTANETRLPIYRGENYILNNRIKAFNLTAHYEIFNISMFSKIIRSYNYGTYDEPIKNLQSTSISNGAEFFFGKDNFVRIIISNDFSNIIYESQGLIINYVHKIK